MTDCYVVPTVVSSAAKRVVHHHGVGHHVHRAVAPVPHVPTPPLVDCTRSASARHAAFARPSLAGISPVLASGLVLGGAALGAIGGYELYNSGHSRDQNGDDFNGYGSAGGFAGGSGSLYNGGGFNHGMNASELRDSYMNTSANNDTIMDQMRILDQSMSKTPTVTNVVVPPSTDNYVHVHNVPEPPTAWLMIPLLCAVMLIRYRRGA